MPNYLDDNFSNDTPDERKVRVATMTFERLLTNSPDYNVQDAYRFALTLAEIKANDTSLILKVATSAAAFITKRALKEIEALNEEDNRL